MSHDNKDSCWRCMRRPDTPFWVDILAFVASICLYIWMFNYVTERIFDRVDRSIILYHLKDRKDNNDW
jgi:hypothetical protein